METGAWSTATSAPGPSSILLDVASTQGAASCGRRQMARVALGDALDVGVAELNAGLGVDTTPEELVTEALVAPGLVR